MLLMTEVAGTLADQVAAEVREGIRAGRYLPGELYSVYGVAEALSVSRSPVREAMLRLAEAGLVEIARNKGFRVLLPDPRDLAEIFAVRLALEVPAAERLARDPVGLEELEAAARAMETARDDATFWDADRRLHRLVLTGAGNRRAGAIVASLRETTALLGEPTGRTRAAICAEHRPVVDAVRRGDPAGARRAMREHLTSTGLLLMARAAGVPADDESVRALWDEVAG
jgi:DNA-binding GntR family transcriptional regulator